MAPDENKQPSFWKQLLTGILDDQKSALKFGLGGAMLGAAAGIALGVYLFATFGLAGVGVCMLGGAIIGFVGAWFMYLSA